MNMSVLSEKDASEIQLAFLQLTLEKCQGMGGTEAVEPRVFFQGKYRAGRS
jgi:hypothetical protein